MPAGIEALATTFLLGLGSAASPCLLPLYPGFIAYLAGAGPNGPADARRGSAFFGLAVLAGVLTTMVVVGLILTLLARPFDDILRWSVPLATFVLVILGVALIAGRNPFARLVGVRAPLVGNPMGQAYVYGLAAGPMTLPCAGPFLVALLAISVGFADGVGRLGSFIVYGFGFGLPLVALSAIGAARGRALTAALARHDQVVLRASGVLLIATALYELIASEFV